MIAHLYFRQFYKDYTGLSRSFRPVILLLIVMRYGFKLEVDVSNLKLRFHFVYSL